MEFCPLLPMLFSKLFCKKIYWLFPSKISHITGGIYSRIEIFLSYFGCWLADHIVVYSKNLIQYWHLESYRSKILMAHEQFINVDTFTITTPFSARCPQIGYIGRFSTEKGVLNFVQAIPTIFSKHKDLMLFIGGGGPLEERIITSLQNEEIISRVTFHNWIAHDDLPVYLNKLQLLVLPSFTEGLPNIMLEAMACGTPVLATSVGAIPDIIKDGETGFILENNSPECIAKNVTRALCSPDLERVSENGRQFIMENFTFEKSVDKWKKIL